MLGMPRFGLALVILFIALCAGAVAVAIDPQVEPQDPSEFVGEDIPLPPGVVALDYPVTPFEHAASVRMFVQPDDREAVYLEPEGRLLSAQERERLDKMFYRRTVLKGGELSAAAACCMPHHEFRYYGPSGVELGRMRVCFCCGCLVAEQGAKGERVSYDGGELEFRYYALQRLVVEMGYRSDYHCRGMTS